MFCCFSWEKSTVEDDNKQQNSQTQHHHDTTTPPTTQANNKSKCSYSKHTIQKETTKPVGTQHSNIEEAAQFLQKGLFKENAPLIFLIWMGSFARTLFSRTLLPWPVLCYSGKILQARFSNTSFGRTLLGSNFWGLLLEQTFCRHCAAFPNISPEN